MVSVHSAGTLPLPAPAEHLTSTATGPHCCSLEDQRKVEGMRGNAVKAADKEEEELGGEEEEEKLIKRQINRRQCLL